LARPSKHDGSIYPRKDGKVLWMVYRDRSGKRIRESTFTEDWREAQRKLRERLQARDDKILDVVRKGEHLQFSDWANFSLENYSKPPIRAEKTHEANGCGSECQWIDPDLAQIVDGFAAQELAADFVMRGDFFLKHGDVAAGGGKSNGNH